MPDPTVRIIIGANAYAVITHDNGTMDVLLSPGKSARNSMLETVDEMTNKAKTILRSAAIIEAAALTL